jgi:hypothetical protein
LFLVLGLLTVAVGIPVFLFLPNNPMSSRLTATDKLAAIERLRSNQTGIENKQFAIHQMVEAFCDPRVGMIVLLSVLGSVVNGALSNYQSAMIKGFGFTSKEAALLSIPSGVIGIIICSGSGYVVARTQQRCLVLLSLYPLGIIGAALMAFTSGKASRLTGNYLTNTVASSPILCTIVAANVSGHSKKVTVNALLLIANSVGNMIGPLTFTTKSAPEFIPAKITIMVCLGLAMLAMSTLRIMLVKENKRREDEGGRAHIVNSEFMNLTDIENKEFRYSL